MPTSPGVHQVSFRNGAVMLKGELTLPESPGPHPAVVLIHGSGPQTRENGMYRYLAAAFNRSGIATLNYDKRGTGESDGDYRDCTFRDLADDALAGLEFLRGNPALNPKRLGIYGHSQGGMVASLAGKSPAVAFVILSSSPVSPAGAQIMEMELRLLKQENNVVLPKEQVREVEVAFRAQNQAARTNRMEDWKAFLDVLQGYETRPWFTQVRHLLPLTEVKARSEGKPYPKKGLWDDYLNNLDFDAIPHLLAIQTPVLAIYANGDRYVDVPLSFPRMAKALQKRGERLGAGCAGSKVLVLDGDHCFVTGVQEGKAVVNAQYVQAIVAWTLR